MITIESLSKTYAKVKAVNNLSLIVNAGELTGFLGPNGAGKSTTIKCILGLAEADSGEILVNGMNPRKDPLEVKKIIGYVPENPVLFSSLTAREFLHLSGSLYGIDSKTVQRKTKDLIEQFGLGNEIDSSIKTFSKGMVQKVTLAASILHNPDILVMDEPFTGLDASSTAVLKEVLKSFASSGKTVLFSSHVMEVVEKLCTQIHIIDEGELKSSGTVDDIKSATGTHSMEEAFISLTGKSNIADDAANIVASVTRDKE